MQTAKLIRSEEMFKPEKVDPAQEAMKWRNFYGSLDEEEYGLDTVVNEHFAAIKQQLAALGVLKAQGTVDDVVRLIYEHNRLQNVSKVDRTNDPHKFWQEYLGKEVAFVNGNFIFEEENGINGKTVNPQRKLQRALEGVLQSSVVVLAVDSALNCGKNPLTAENIDSFLSFAKSKNVILHFNSPALKERLRQDDNGGLDDEELLQSVTELMIEDRSMLLKAADMEMQFTHSETGFAGNDPVNVLFHYNPAGRLPRQASAAQEDQHLSFPSHLMANNIISDPDLMKEWEKEFQQIMNKAKFFLFHNIPHSLSCGVKSEQYWKAFDLVRKIVASGFYRIINKTKHNAANGCYDVIPTPVNFLKLGKMALARDEKLKEAGMDNNYSKQYAHDEVSRLIHYFE